LFLSHNHIRKLKGLDNLRNLKALVLYYNEISKLENLSQLINLKELYMDGNQISIIEGLGSLDKLRKISLWKNNIPSEVFDKFRQIDEDEIIAQKVLEYCRKNKK